MEENRNKRIVTKMMANQSKKRTSQTLLNKGKQVADIQSQPGVIAHDISILENEQLVAPTPPNSPTMEG